MATKYHKPVARAASLAAALALTIPLAPLAASASKSATAVAVRGTVVATNAARHTLVVSAGGAVDTVRFQSAGAVAKVALGSVVSVRATRLADGTFKALSMRDQGHATHTLIHGTVVSTTATGLVISAGGSTVPVNRGSAVKIVAKSGRQSHASGSSLGVGTDVRVGVVIQPTGLDATSIVETGQSGFVGLDGTVASISPATPASLATLVINVEDGATTTVTIPASITIPSTIKVGDIVELNAAYAKGTFTLVTITDDSIAATQAANGVTTSEDGSGSIQAEGLVTAFTAATAMATGSLTVQPGDGAATVTFTLSVGTSLPANLQSGSRVDVTGSMSGTTLTANSVYLKQSDGEDNGSMTTETSGAVLQLPSSSSPALVIQPGDGQSPVSFLVPAGVDVSSIALGARIDATGNFVNGQLTLQNFQIQQPEGDQGNQNNQGNLPATLHTDGAIVSDNGGLLVLLPGDGAAPITITIPSTIDVSTFASGVKVAVTATVQNGVLTLTSIALND